MTRRYRHNAPWSSLDDAWSRLRLTPPLDTITLRDGRQYNYRWLPARDPILIFRSSAASEAIRVFDATFTGILAADLLLNQQTRQDISTPDCALRVLVPAL